MAWATIPRFPDYLISDKGEVMSFRPKNGRGPRCATGRLMKPSKIKGKKYVHVPLLDVTGTRIWRKVHLLVLECFRGPCPPGMQGCHADDDQTNNLLSNLRWDTHANNVLDKIANGKQVRGNDSPRSILTEDQAREIKAMFPTWGRNTTSQLATKFGVSWSAINSIRIGRTWSSV